MLLDNWHYITVASSNFLYRFPRNSEKASLESFHICYDCVTPRFLKVLSPAFESPLLLSILEARPKFDSEHLGYSYPYSGKICSVSVCAELQISVEILFSSEFSHFTPLNFLITELQGKGRQDQKLLAKQPQLLTH